MVRTDLGFGLKADSSRESGEAALHTVEPDEYGRILDLAGITGSELRGSFALCRQIHQRALPASYLAVEILSAQKRPYLHALCGFVAETDRIADEGDNDSRCQALVEWQTDALADLQRQHSANPVRRAMLHVVDVWGLDVGVLAEFLAAMRVDACAPPEFAAFADLRRNLRGVAGTIFSLFARMLEPIGDETTAARLMSVLGEAVQLTDILQDFAIDLPRGRCYLPTADLRRLRLTSADLLGGKPSRALDSLVALEVRRARRLLNEGACVIPLVHPSSRPFLVTAVSGITVQLDEIARMESRALWEDTSIPLPETLLTVSTLKDSHPDSSFGDGLPPARSGAKRSRPVRRTSRPRVVPGHVAIIADGNRRWAAARKRPAIEGHSAGANAVPGVVDASLELGIRYLTLFVFSTENWTRSKEEVCYLLELMGNQIRKLTPRFDTQQVRIRWCGRRNRVVQPLRAALEEAESITAGNDRLTLTLCIDYGGRAEIIDAARRLATEGDQTITEDDFTQLLYQPDLPAVDLLIRTSGERRISNFLLWHNAYSEIVFDDTLWPDFGRAELESAIADYGSRERRFGGTAVAAC
jgi:undecaprenyl diphosphate synthase